MVRISDTFGTGASSQTTAPRNELRGLFNVKPDPKHRFKLPMDLVKPLQQAFRDVAGDIPFEVIMHPSFTHATYVPLTPDIAQIVSIKAALTPSITHQTVFLRKQNKLTIPREIWDELMMDENESMIIKDYSSYFEIWPMASWRETFEDNSHNLSLRLTTPSL